ncbi:hypothetical protein JTB14_019012 [Gonioctena quinquepunctata]|nr:hypothetical protein JTB14_019012 [Gonioctena quinquepunctata]
MLDGDCIPREIFPIIDGIGEYLHAGPIVPSDNKSRKKKTTNERNDGGNYFRSNEEFTRWRGGVCDQPYRPENQPRSGTLIRVGQNRSARYGSMWIDRMNIDLRR